MKDNTIPNFSSQKTDDVLLNVFLETTLGGVDHELDDWSDGITDLLHEEYAGSHRRASWDYFRGFNEDAKGLQLLGVAEGSNVVPFPLSGRNDLPLSA
jgi:hypothetical protein